MLMQHGTDFCRSPVGPSITALKELLHPSLGALHRSSVINHSLQVVLSTELVLARPFYGYHAEDRLFVKIKLYNPSQVNRIATLLQVSDCMRVLAALACLAAQRPKGQPGLTLSVGWTVPCAEASSRASSVLMGSGWLQTGAVLNRVFEIHESHIPYLLQFKVSTVILRL